MKRYGYFQAIIMSFYSADLYRDVTRNWGGRVWGYLLLVLTICCLADVVAMQLYINRNYDAVAERNLDVIVKQIPEITLRKDGTIETPENRPYTIQNPKNKDILAVIDTSGHYTTLENQNFDILFTKNKFYLRNSNGTVEIRPLPSNVNYHFQAEAVRPKIKAFLTTWVGILLFPFLLVLAFLGRLIQSLLYALIGKILSWVGKNELNYFTIVAIAVVALTPAIVVDTILEILGNGFRGQGLLMFFVTTAYLYYGIQANKFISRD